MPLEEPITEVLDNTAELAPLRPKMGRIDGASLIKQTFVSLFIVTGVAVSWACAAQFSQSALRVDPDKFQAPYSMVWFSTIFMLICYPVYLIYAITAGKQGYYEAHEEAMEVFGSKTFNIL